MSAQMTLFREERALAIANSYSTVLETSWYLSQKTHKCELFVKQLSCVLKHLFITLQHSAKALRKQVPPLT